MSITSSIVRSILVPALEIYDRTSILNELHKLEKTQYLSTDELHAIQLEKLKKILVHSYSHVPFYRSQFIAAGFDPQKIRGVDDIRVLPLLTKDLIASNQESLRATNYSVDQVHRSASGGSTGKHTAFLRDNGCLNIKRAAQLRFDGFTGWQVGEKVANVWPALQDVSSSFSIKTWIRRLLFDRRLMLAAGNLDENRLYQLFKDLRRYQPSLIRAFPNPLAQLAKYMSENGHVLSTQGVLVTGEPLLSSQRLLFESVFNAPVFDCYGSRECGQHACECMAHDGLHINSECLIIQFEHNGKPCRPGEAGRIIITDLDNFGMPFIRYDIQDVGVPMPGLCACGRSLPRMSVQAGRVSDFIVSPHDRSLVSGATMCHYLLAEGPDVGQIQLVQDRIDHLEIRLRRSSADADIRETHLHFSKTLNKIFAGQMKFDITVMESIPHEPSGKYRFCINQMIDKDCKSMSSS